jgi:hypothetical protein
VSFTVEWPMLTNRVGWLGSAGPETASFPYYAAEWDSIESVQLEVVGRVQKRIVRVEVMWNNQLGYHATLVGGVVVDCSASGYVGPVVLEFPEGGSASQQVSQVFSTSCSGVGGRINATVSAQESGGQVTVTVRYDSFECSNHGTWLSPGVSDSVTVGVGLSGTLPDQYFENPNHVWQVSQVSVNTSYVIPSVTLSLAPGNLGAVTINSMTPQRYLSADFKASLSNGSVYRLSLDDPQGVGVILYGARLLIKQSNTAAKTIIPYELGAYFFTRSPSYVDITPLSYYRHVASRWDGNFEIILEAEAAGDADVAVRDGTGAVVVAVSTSGPSRQIARSAPVTLTDGVRYNIAMRSRSGANILLYSARLLFKFTGLGKIAIPRSLLENIEGFGTANVETTDAFYWDPSYYSGSVIGNAVVEHVIRAGDGVTVTSALFDGTSEVGVVTSGSGAHDLYVSQEFTLPSVIRSYKGRARASASSGFNRVRTWRVIIPVTFGVLVPASVGIGSAAPSHLYGFRCEIFWPLLGKETTISTGSTSATWQSSTRRVFRPARMNGIVNNQALWIVIYTRSAGSHTVRLRGQAAGVIASFSVGTGTRVQTTAIPVSSLGNGDQLFIEVSSGTNASLTLHYAALVFPLAGPLVCEPIIELGTEGRLTAPGTAVGRGRFLWDSRLYPPGSQVRFIASLKGTGRAELVRDDGAVVAQLVGGTALVLVETAPIELQHGREYYVRYVSTGTDFTFGGAGLSVTVPGGQYIRAITDLAHEFSQSPASTWTRYALGVPWRAGNWVPVYDVAHEVTASATNPAEMGIGDGADTPIAASVVSVGSANTRLRSASFPLPGGADVRVLSRRTTANATTVTAAWPRLLVGAGTPHSFVLGVPVEVVSAVGTGTVETAVVVFPTALGVSAGAVAGVVDMSVVAPAISVGSQAVPGTVYLLDIVAPASVEVRTGSGVHDVQVDFQVGFALATTGVGAVSIGPAFLFDGLQAGTGAGIPAAVHGPGRVIADVGEVRVIAQEREVGILLPERDVIARVSGS